MKLIFVSSLEVHCRDVAVSRLLGKYPEALVIGHDLLEGNRVLRRVEGKHNATERAESVLEHGCIGCAVRFEILPTLLRLLPGREDAVVIQLLPATWHSDQVLDIVRSELAGRGVTIDHVVLALDPAATEDQFWDRRTLWESGFNAMPNDERTAGEFLIRELALADSLMFVEGVSVELLGESAEHLKASGEQYEHGARLIAELAPHAALNSGASEVVLGDYDQHEALLRSRPGHFSHGAGDSEIADSKILIRVERPLDADRFREVLPEVVATCMCVRGTLWMASCPGVRVALTGTGPRVWMESTGAWESDVACTHLELTGSEHCEAEVRALLESCELSDEQLLALHGASSATGPDQEESDIWGRGESV
ncbi:GTP-binding protein [Glutamicibacter sp. AOP12-B1-11]|uniref:GTP-binding protein n=1 Tax=Glutamicibacter sp. AOP12-B1-11 TaxID=3457725 RepID=UPI0040347C23